MQSAGVRRAAPPLIISRVGDTALLVEVAEDIVTRRRPLREGWFCTVTIGTDRVMLVWLIRQLLRERQQGMGKRYWP